MGVFADAAEIDAHVGALFREALADADIGPRMRSAGLTLRIVCHEPACELVLRLHDPVSVTEHGHAPFPVVTLGLCADHLDGFLSGTYSLIDGMVREEIQVRGPVSRALRALAHLEPDATSYRTPTTQRPRPPSPRRPRAADTYSQAGTTQT